MIAEKSLKKAEQKAIEVLTKFKVTAAPIPILDIVKRLEIHLIPYDLSEDVSGILIIDDKLGTIGYNPTNSKVRQRFTIAHELGHYLLHNDSKSEVFIDRDFIVKYRSEKKYTVTEIRQEQEANAFAAAILMPKEIIQAELARADYQDLSENDFIETLSKVFEVSIPAMTYRLSNLDLFGF